MSAEANNEGGSVADTLKLVLAIAILVVGIVGFYQFQDQPTWMRLLGLLVAVGVSGLVTVQTRVGREVWRFAVDSRTEVRKVVWPTRQETLQTLLIIVIFVLVMALFLWAVDSILFTIVRYATERG
ncbi:preprotein translocase subunit SecE [endosymbiont of unidentified scaly snail isolate Monju]|uniref:preprotein translocase subunit SecE n=1 Tax=endosymbiont of unidentified scaly snail isolate Monju TaxID=1248727 RepID=UPI0003892D15|nr:preprotein translocase subunit SecE [endosymbiont of unidentified scaly snail isolate Monju]BAN68156.1 preprotein translocase subunit SecE [endosymbiont of unidentified scaly snail isolate Monju]